jgi:hypothetical protein
MTLVACKGQADEEEPSDGDEQKQVQDRFTATAARFIALREAARDLADRLRRNGLTIRSDISTSVRLIESELDRAESELRSGHYPKCRMRLDRINTACDRLKAKLEGN